MSVVEAMASRPEKGMRRRYKSACDQCHASKVKCPGGGPPCKRCVDDSNGARCRYSFVGRLGKPPGTRNKKTLERIRRAQQAEGSESAIESDPDALGLDNARAAPEDHPRADSKLLVQIPWLRDLEPLSPLSPPASHPGPSETPNSSPLEPDPPSSIQGLTGDFLDAFHNAGPVEFSGMLDFPGLETFGGEPPTKQNGQQTASPLISPVVDSEISQADSARDLLFNEDAPSFEKLLRRLNAADATTSSRRGNQSTSPCLCLSRYTRALSQLQAVEAGQHPVQADTLLASTSLILTAANTQLRCNQCIHDSRVALRLVLIVQTIFTWVEAHCQPLSAWRPEKVTLGAYSLTPEEANFVKMSVLLRAVEKARAVLHAAMARLAQADRTREQSFPSGTCKTAHLEASFHALVQSSDNLTQRLLMLRS